MRKILIVACLVALIGVPLFAFAQTTNPVQVSLSIPGTNQAASTGSPINFIDNVYQFALLICGLLAFGAIVYGGVKYITAAGNPSGQSEGKEWIYGALLGLALLVSAYLILNTINPALVNLTLPTLQQTSLGTQGGSGSPIQSPTTPTGCVAGVCQSLAGQPGITCKAGAGCSAAPAEVALLNCIEKTSGQNLRITEGYPPAPGQGHQAQCHNNGCCVDLTPSNGQSASCSQVQSIMTAAQQCGAIQALNEFPPSCGGTNYTYTNGSNIHIQGC